MRYGLCLVVLCALGSLAWAGAAAPGLAGQWLGALKVPGGELRVLFRIATDRSGAYTGTLDSLDQGARGIPVGSVTVEGEKVRIEVPAVSGRFEGKLTADPRKLEGTWYQGGQELPLTLTPTEGVAPPNRPQTPKKPYP